MVEEEEEEAVRWVVGRVIRRLRVEGVRGEVRMGGCRWGVGWDVRFEKERG